MSTPAFGSQELPVRAFMTDPKIKWRNGKPDYSIVNNKYMSERQIAKAPGSLEKVVEDILKTWEMESSHKIDEKDWETVDKKVFTISVNGGKKYTLHDNITLGNYNILMDVSPLYDAKNTSNDESHHRFRNALPGGFAWEVLEVFSGPPTVTFTWRHWGTWSGNYLKNTPTGETIELTGSCVARVSKDLKVECVDVYYDPNPMLAKLLKLKDGKCPMGL